MKLLAIAALAATVAGCATLGPPACPAGQESLRTAQLYLGARGQTAPSDADLKRFVFEEVSPRFSGGVTVLDGGAQWKGPQEQWMRESAKVLMIVLPPGPLALVRVNAVKGAYLKRFGHEPAGVFVREGCVVP